MSELPTLFRFAVRAPRSALRAGALTCALALALSACRGPQQKEPMPTPRRPLTEVLAAHTPGLMALPGVVGTAEARMPDGRPCILVMVARMTPELRSRLPHELEGWPVRTDVTGEIRALPDSAR